MHGQGKLTWEDQSYYDGSWVQDMMEGEGLFVWSDKRSYQGEWKNSLMHFKGVTNGLMALLIKASITSTKSMDGVSTLGQMGKSSRVIG